MVAWSLNKIRNVLIVFILTLLLGNYVHGFSTSYPLSTQTGIRRQMLTYLSMAGLFDDIGKFFSGDKDDENSSMSETPRNSNRSDGTEDEDDEEEYAGSTRILTIPGEKDFKLTVVVLTSDIQTSSKLSLFRISQIHQTRWLTPLFDAVSHGNAKHAR
jgi:hypothetical protein